VILKENYDAEGNLYVMREHYVIDEDGKREYPTETYSREGTRQESCPFAPIIEEAPDCDCYSSSVLQAYSSSRSSKDSLFSNRLQKIMMAILVRFYLIF